MEDFSQLQISHTLCYPTGPGLRKLFLWEILAFDAGACMFVLNIFWNGRLIILRSILKHWPYFLSNITTDRGQIELHFSGFYIPAEVFDLATGQLSPQGHIMQEQ